MKRTNTSSNNLGGADSLNINFQSSVGQSLSSVNNNPASDEFLPDNGFLSAGGQQKRANKRMADFSANKQVGLFIKLFLKNT